MMPTIHGHQRNPPTMSPVSAVIDPLVPLADMPPNTGPHVTSG